MNDLLKFIMPPMLGAIFGLLLLFVLLVSYCVLTWTMPFTDLWVIAKETYLWMMVGFAIMFWGMSSNY